MLEIFLTWDMILIALLLIVAVLLIVSILQRRRIVERLRLFEAVVEASQEAIAISDAEGRLIYINSAHARLFGRSLEEAQQLNYRMYYPPESVQILEQEVVPALARGESWEGILDVFDAQGRRFPLWERADSVRDADGQMHFGFGLMHDASEQVRAETILRENTAYYGEILEGSNDILYRICLPSFTYDYISASATRILGYTPERLKMFTQEEWLGLLHPDDRTQVQGYLEHLNVHSVDTPIVTLQYRFKTKTGVYRWLSDRRRVVRDAEGQAEYIVGNIRDVTDQKRATDELARAESLLMAAIVSTPAGVLVADAPDVKIRIANAAALGIRGETSQPLVDIPMDLHPQHWQTFYPDGRQYAPDALPLSRAILQGETVENEEVIIQRQSGERRWVLATAAPVRNAEGDIIAGVVVFPDITEYKQMAQALRESEEKYRRVVDNVNEAITVYQDGELKFFNPRTVEIVGRSQKELLAHSFIEFIHPEDRGLIFERHRQRLQGEDVPDIYEFRVIDKDGDVRWVEIHVVLIEWEGQPATLNFLIDITERKQAEGALQANAERFRSLVQNLSDVVWVIDENVVITYETPSVLRVTGYPAGFLLGKNGLEFIHPDDLDVVKQDLDEVFREENPLIPTEFRFRHADGRWIYLEAVASNMLEHASIQGIIITARDITERKKAEAQLKESEARYRNIVELAPEGIATVDMKGWVTSCNTAFVTLTGYAKDDIVGKHFSKIPTLSLRDLPEYTRIFARAIRGRLETPVEFRWLHKDGTRRWGEAYIGLMRDEGGLRGIQAIVVDTTKRKHADQMLQALNQAALATNTALNPDEVFNAVAGEFKKLDMHYVVFLADKDLTHLFPKYLSYQFRVLRAVEKLVGLNRETFSIVIDQVDLYRRIIRDKETVFLEDVEDAMRQILPEHVQDFAGRAVKLLKMTHFIAAPLIAENEVMGVLSVQSHDLIADDVPTINAFAHQIATAWRKAQLFEQAQLEIAERKRAEAEREQLLVQVRAQAQQMQQIVDTVPEGVLLLSPNGQIVLANPVARRDLLALATLELGDVIKHLGGYPLDELLTSPPEGFWHDIQIGERGFELIARPLETGSAPSGWVLVTRDVTQEREIQHRIQQQERLAAVGQLAAGIAHDFNNIMAVIVLYTQMALRSPDLSSKIRQNLETAAQQAWRATDLIQQILDFGRQSVLEQRSLDLVPFLKEQVKLFERTLPENIEIQFEYSADSCVIHADPTRIQQVMMNLAVNARDAMPYGGALYIVLDSISVTEAEQSPLPDMHTGEWVQVSVRDTGTGIPEDVLPHIYEPFFTTKPPGQGSGLGLAQVYGIVKLHAGEIDVESYVEATEGRLQGTTFRLYFPALSMSDSDTLVPGMDTQDFPQGCGELILLVEDNDVTRQALQESLEFLNYRVVVAPNGIEALKVLAARGDEITLVLSDVVMPEMGGLALLHAMRERGLEVPVVLLTGHPMAEELELLKEQGMIDWLPKPPSLAKLAEVLKRA